MSDAMIYPVLAMILLTMLVWMYMYYLRIGYSLKHKIHAQKLSTPEKCNTLLPEDVNQPSNNFKNLFEAPVIFYVMTILIIITNSTDSTFVYLGWAYVGLRSIHSLIHCVFNNVMVRFVTYFVSTVLLWVMLIKFALSFV